MVSMAGVGGGIVSNSSVPFASAQPHLMKAWTLSIMVAPQLDFIHLYTLCLQGTSAGGAAAATANAAAAATAGAGGVFAPAAAATAANIAASTAAAAAAAGLGGAAQAGPSDTHQLLEQLMAIHQHLQHLQQQQRRRVSRFWGLPVVAIFCLGVLSATQLGMAAYLIQTA